jgi:hypothetical protein
VRLAALFVEFSVSTSDPEGSNHPDLCHPDRSGGTCSFFSSPHMLVERTADPSTALRCGRDDKGQGGGCFPPNRMLVESKIGYATVGEDFEVVGAIRKAVGDEMAIMVDYNQCLTPVKAVRRLRALDGEGLTWVEEPDLAHAPT